MVLPIFLVLVFAIVDFGMGLNAWITVTNSAREGVRLGAVGGTTSAIQTKVLGTAATLPGTPPTVTVTNAQGTPGTSVKVHVVYHYNFISPLSSLVSFVSGDNVGPTLNISSDAEMRLE
jgi:Flp pilus assembly protein TadG